ncbi:protein kinase [Nocardiopsis synnemataformans]|uniref:protein kinase n=1 Tax=Nocardiopsis synnemataformans TaxID=61305 RepID=UPI003EBF4187
MDPTITDLIRPRTGRIESIKPASGFGASSTGFVYAEQGRFFVKATPQGSRDLEAARREAAVNSFIRSVSPAVRWKAENEDWFVLGIDVVEGRSADFLPESSDLPTVVDTLNRVSALPLPDVARGWTETRWDRFVTDSEKELLRGDALTHTDIHGRNFLIGAEETWLVDWEWPTRATPAAMPTCLAVQLVSSGHSPESAESWVSKMVAWEMSSPESLRIVARANARLNRWFAELRADEKWLGAMAEAAEAWADHRDGGSSA